MSKERERMKEWYIKDDKQCIDCEKEPKKHCDACGGYGSEEDEIDEEKFLAKYIVPNYYLPQHLGVMPSEIEGFKDFVIKWGMSGEMNVIMKELLENFRKSQ
jgi:hypothetical protein